MEPGQSAIFEWNLVIEANQLQEHIANQEHQILDIAGFVLHRHVLHRRFWWTSALRRRVLTGGRGGLSEGS